jgi:putative transposase
VEDAGGSYLDGMLGFKSMRCAKILLAGSETMDMIRKDELNSTKEQVASAANQFYSLAL